MDTPSEIQTSPPDQQPRPRRTLTHLLVGSLAFGLDALSQRLSDWGNLPPPHTQETGAPENVDLLEAARVTGAIEPLISDVLLPETEHAPGQVARYALVGMLFNAQDRLSSNINRADRLTRRLYQGSASLLRPLSNSPLAAPLTSRWDRLVRRGERQVSEWVERGKAEEGQGVIIARQVVEGTTGEVIEVLSVHPGIKDLVEKHSTSFAGEIVEEIRERTVSLDTLLERLARRILRKPPRLLLAPPPQQPSGTESGPITTQAGIHRE